MVLKPEIRNEHREAFRAKKFDEIPAKILEKLKAEQPQPQKGEAKLKADKKDE